MRWVTVAAATAAIVLGAAQPALAQPPQGPVRVGGGHDAPKMQLPPIELSAEMSDAELGTALDAWLGTLAAEGAFDGVVLLARDGQPVYSAAYGDADRAAARRNTIETPFNIASLGKSFTETAVAQLVEAGAVSMDDTIGKWLPDYPNEISRAATIADLLEHRAGIADFFGPEFDRLPKEQFASNADHFRYVSQRPPLFAPGERQEYCNGCFIVLGEIVAAASGMKYEEYVGERILAKVGAVATTCMPSADTAHPYERPRPDPTLEDVMGLHGAGCSAAGGWYSTAADLLAFEQALRSNVLAGPEATRRMLGDGSRGPLMRGGGSAGVNALLAGDGEWTLIVLANRDPPIALAMGETVFPQLPKS